MDRRKEKNHHHHQRTTRSHTLPSSPTHSHSSSSDFEFTISLSPRKSSAALCPADELFYKGQLLPLHLSPRLSMVRTLLLSSSSTSSSSTAATASRASTDSSSSSDLLSDSSRPSSANDDDLNRLIQLKKPSKYFSLSRFSNVFKKDISKTSPPQTKITSAKEVIRKYLKKVKPLYEKLSQKHQQKASSSSSFKFPRSENATLCLKTSIIKDKDRSFNKESSSHTTISHSFSGNLRYPRRRSYISSCPSSMRSSPSHSGILVRNGLPPTNRAAMNVHADASSMEELQSAIQGAIAHCKNSMLQNKTMVSNEI